jgi:hypothetical protein
MTLKEILKASAAANGCWINTKLANYPATDLIGLWNPTNFTGMANSKCGYGGMVILNDAELHSGFETVFLDLGKMNF